MQGSANLLPVCSVDKCKALPVDGACESVRWSMDQNYHLQQNQTKNFILSQGPTGPLSSILLHPISVDDFPANLIQKRLSSFLSVGRRGAIQALACNSAKPSLCSDVCIQFRGSVQKKKKTNREIKVGKAKGGGKEIKHEVTHSTSVENNKRT